MKFFSSLLSEANTLLSHLPQKAYAYDSANAWMDLGYHQVILQRDSSYELSGTGFNLITTSTLSDEVIIIGEDLSHISTNRPFARLSLVQIDDTYDEQEAYNLIRKIEYVKYHYFPDGYMLRTTSRSHKEAVRVSKNAIKDGISFERIGNLLINKYKEIPGVKGVRIIFITQKNAAFQAFEALAEKNHQITETLNHVMNSVNWDCSTCTLKPICDEAEGMRELHFRRGI